MPEGWASAEDISSAQQIQKTDSSVSGSSSLAVSPEFTAIGGKGGDVAVYSNAAEKELVHSFNVGSAITQLIFADENIVLGTAKGEVKIYTTQGSELASFSEHAGPVTGLARHPGSTILLSVGADKSFIFYDMDALRTVFRRYTTSCKLFLSHKFLPGLPTDCVAALTTCAFHPDGHLFAAGTQDGSINVFSTKTGDSMAVFNLGAPVSALVFSENGYWFAAGSAKAANIVIFDLRKEGDAARAKELPTTGPVRSLAWDYSAQFLAVAGPGGIAVHHYVKGSRSWTVLLETGERATAVQWGDKATSLEAIGEEGQLVVFSRAE